MVHLIAGYMFVVEEIVNSPALEAEAAHDVGIDVRFGLEMMVNFLTDQLPRSLSEWAPIDPKDGFAVYEERCRMVPKLPKNPESRQNHREANHHVDIPAGVVGKSLARKVKNDNHLAVAHLCKLVHTKHKHISASKAGRRDDKDSLKERRKCRSAQDEERKKHIASCVADGNVGDGDDPHGNRKTSKGTRKGDAQIPIPKGEGRSCYSCRQPHPKVVELDRECSEHEVPPDSHHNDHCSNRPR